MGDIEVGAEVSAVNFLLENLYAMYMPDRGATSAHVDEFAEEMLRQFALPGTTHGRATETQFREVQELATHRLEMFFARVKDRFKSAEG